MRRSRNKPRERDNQKSRNLTIHCESPYSPLFPIYNYFLSNLLLCYICPEVRVQAVTCFHPSSLSLLLLLLFLPVFSCLSGKSSPSFSQWAVKLMTAGINHIKSTLVAVCQCRVIDSFHQQQVLLLSGAQAVDAVGQSLIKWLNWILA